MDDDIAIKVQHISKTFHEQVGARSFKSAFVNIGRGLIGKKTDKTSKDFTALKDINFEVKKGEFFGIVGRNGSGKSTLLKILAGVYTPTKGAVAINGKLTPFIELGVGFNPELSGRDNVFLNGALLGFTRKQMETMYDDIVEFAELKEFMDVKLKNYSSGMQVRLAFSVAIKADSDILLIDEVLAVGDAAFQLKCQEYFVQLKNDKRTVILVTHDMNAVKRYCDRAMIIDKGSFKSVDYPKIIAEQYEEINNQDFRDDAIETKSNQDKISNGARILQFTLTDEKDNPKKVYKYKEKIKIKITYLLTKDITNLSVDIGLTLGKNGLLFYYHDSGQEKTLNAKKEEKVTIECVVQNIFTEGTYYVITSMYDCKTHEVYARDGSSRRIRITKLPSSSIVLPDNKVSVIKE